MTFPPYFKNNRNGVSLSTQVKSLLFNTHQLAKTVCTVVNSSLFYWWFILLSDCRYLNMREIERFPIGLETMSPQLMNELTNLSDQLIKSYAAHAKRKDCTYKATGSVSYDEYYPKHSKPIIDEIDTVLAKHYGFTAEELDYIINYDIKYRMGSSEEAEDDAD